MKSFFKSSKKNIFKFNAEKVTFCVLVVCFCFAAFFLSKLNLFKKIKIGPCIYASEISKSLDKKEESDVDVRNSKNIFVPDNLKSRSFIEGYEDKTFKPDENLTRAEASQMLYKLMYNGTRINFDTLKKYHDLDENKWYSCAIAYLVNKKIIKTIEKSGCDFECKYKYFNPNENINRAEFSQIVFNVLRNYNKKIFDDKINNDCYFDDISDNFSKDAINELGSLGFLEGYGDKKFFPDKKINRAEAVKLITKTFSRDIKDKENIFIDLEEGHWAYKFILSAT
ncbi:MAG: S-layer homology domain-containing protein [Clostridiales bacterium]|jgi:hypothetical protein|nr:S-layer homology domain-containing protein [Clostridiales bacterium]